MTIQFRNSETLSPPPGHYSHYTIAGGFVFVSGQLPVDKFGVPQTTGTFAEQTAFVFAKIEACLLSAGVTKQQLVQVRVYVTDMVNWPEFNQLYSEWMGNTRPARAVAGVAQLHYDAALEVEVVAYHS